MLKLNFEILNFRITKLAHLLEKIMYFQNLAFYIPYITAIVKYLRNFRNCENIVSSKRIILASYSKFLITLILF